MHNFLMFTALMLATLATAKTTGVILTASFFAFFTRIFDGIGKVFRDLMNKAKPFLAKEIPVAIAVVNWLKTAVENPLVDYATTAIPGNLDNLIVDKAKDILPKLLTELKLFQIAASTNDNATIIQEGIKYLQSVDPDKRYGKYLEIANYLTVALVDGKLSWSEIVHAVQIGYDENVNHVALAA